MSLSHFLFQPSGCISVVLATSSVSPDYLYTLLSTRPLRLAARLVKPLVVVGFVIIFANPASFPRPDYGQGSIWPDYLFMAVGIHSRPFSRSPTGGAFKLDSLIVSPDLRPQDAG
ncbi:unnamed protein product [Protopolystoma xenopodis]|uniref:Uncharacterized protein n=1 Tax=Protopolystoma xenopodis TaxID=117903 RepID=A0A3S5BTG1_9PLAT|nr:unnamed protein product [Protopolystoma xenopodis]